MPVSVIIYFASYKGLENNFAPPQFFPKLEKVALCNNTSNLQS